jgi:hypothetical protein
VAARLDPFGNSIVLGMGIVDGLPLLRVLKYDAAGALAWSRSAFPGHFPTGLAVGPSGESVVAAEDYPFDPTPVLSVAKFDAAGNEVWTRSYPVALALIGNATAVAVSAAGDVYVAGWASDFGTGRLVAVRYSPNGDLLWAFVDSSPSGFVGEPVRLALLPGGGAVVAGHVYDRSLSRDVLRVCATDAAGTEDWAVQLDHPTLASALAVGDSGRVFVGAGYAGIHAIDPGGVVAWSLEPKPEEFPAWVKVTSPTARGHATQYPAGHVPPTASLLNHGPDQTRASQAVARLGDGGRIGLRPVQAGGSLHVIVDVVGYFE